MSGRGPSADKAMDTAVLVCQESYACGGTDEASFECDECGSLQCTRCELELHRQERMRNHDRVRIGPGHVPFCDACKGAGDCSRLRAAVRCQGCKTNLCLDCQKRTHTGVNKKKHPLTQYPPPPPPATAAQPGALADGEAEMETLKAQVEKVCSFLLVDDREEMQVKSEEDFVGRLGCRPDELLKVVSIFGNTGEGKSHTLNHTFFLGREVFKTAPTQESCTVGVWAAMDPVHRVVVIDTEGLLGAAGANQGQRTRLLLKVLAVSDLVIYRTHTDRLHDDLFKFLGDASDAYLKHFARELKATTARCGLDVPLSTLGPAVVIFHETVHTKLLGSDKPSESAERLLQERFRKLGLFPEAFSSVQYRGTRTYNPPTDFSGLLHTLEQQLDNNTTRSPRTASVIYKALQALSERFSGEVTDEHLASNCFFPDEYFTCSSICLSCGCSCKSSMNHLKEETAHDAKHRCRYSAQLVMSVGKEVIVVPKTTASSDSPLVWPGHLRLVRVRADSTGTGNQDPVDTVVRTEIQHIWPGSNGFLKDNNNAAQRLLDGVSYISQSCRSSASSRPSGHLLAHGPDCPGLLEAQLLILGFCDACSSKSRPVPERGWGLAPVREEEGGTLIARKVGEAVQSTLGAVVGAIDIPLGLVKEAARPAYWVPDQDIHACCECQREFAPACPSTTAGRAARACATSAPRRGAPCRPAAGTTPSGSATLATRSPGSYSQQGALWVVGLSQTVE
ncbi:hypothetical protein CRUP_023587, partial [Coryphaenoides rupestris]